MSHGTNGTKVTAAMFALSATLVACLTGLFLVIQSAFPWMTVFNQRTAETAAVVDGSNALVDVTAGGPSAAERVITQVMATPVKALQGRGWAEIQATGGVPGVSFGFGCDPTDGLAPVVAEARSWVQTQRNADTSLTRAVGSLDVSARAYPAGGGAAAFAGLSEAVLRCDDARLFTAQGVGVEVTGVLASDTAALVWRRGDVLMVGRVTASGGPGSTSANMDVFRAFDAALKKALAETCLDPAAGVDDARRSPYLNRTEFFGNSETIPVKRPKSKTVLAAEARTSDPVVPIPAPRIEMPYVSFLPTPPLPAVTKGPTALPMPVPFPTEPSVPTNAPTHQTGVDRKIDDPDGPGCGWAFTGQVPPNFDAEAASADFAKATKAAKRAMSISWVRWQEAKETYYAAYATYTRATEAYTAYAAEVAEVSQAWAEVESARTAYYADLDAYNAAVAALAQWKSDRDAAKVEFAEAKQECRRLANEPDPEPEDEPSSGPTTGPSSGPTTSASPSPSPSPTAAPMVCPPVRPLILDAVAPTVPEMPVPAKEAQLPPIRD